MINASERVLSDLEAAWPCLAAPDATHLRRHV